jgi:hypothetical protein
MSKRSRRLDDVEDTPYSKRRVVNRCCWPDCPQPKTEHTQLCTSHLYIAHEAYAKILAGMPLPSRVTFTVQAEPEPVEPKPEKPGTIYYVRSGGYIKIGWTSDLSKRMKGYPPDSVLMATHPGTRSDETTVHRKFAVHRTHGREWYALVPAIMGHIARVQAEHGEPEQVSFGARPVEVPRPGSRKTIGRIGGVRHVS